MQRLYAKKIFFQPTDSIDGTRAAGTLEWPPGRQSWRSASVLEQYADHAINRIREVLQWDVAAKLDTESALLRAAWPGTGAH